MRARVGGRRDTVAEAKQLSDAAGVATTGEGLCVCSCERVRVLDGNLTLVPLG
jgi:hypothetical protein